jgi:hypothetical protein
MTRIALWACVFALCGWSVNALASGPTPGPTPIRLGGSINVGIGFFYPSAANDYIQSQLDDEILSLGQLVGRDLGRQEAVPTFAYVPVQVAALVRIMDAFQAWWEAGTANGSGWTLDEFFNGYYEYAFYEQVFHEKVVFTPSWRALGANVVYVAGGPNSLLRPMVGAGLGYYTGAFREERSGRYSETGAAPSSWDGEHRFVGDAVGGSVILGFSFVPARNVELECRLTGRYARVPELKLDNQVLRDPAHGNEKVELDLSGVDFRLGVRILLP